jgi:hypothetical protein
VSVVSAIAPKLEQAEIERTKHMVIREQGYLHAALRIATASAALAGRVDEATKLCTRLQQLDPALRVSNLKDVLGPYKPEAIAKYEEGLRKAGLPE